MTESILLRDLSIVMVVAAATTLLCHAVRLPAVVGYLVAGLLIGPHTPPFSLVGDPQSIHTMADLGIIFLIFTIGLDFSLPKLRRIGPAAAGAMVIEVLGMVLLGYGLGQWLGWTRIDSLFLGAIISITSTSIIAKVFMDMRIYREPWAQMTVGISIMEDIAAIALLTLLSGIAAGQGLAGGAAIEAVLRSVIFVIIFSMIGLGVVPRLIRRVARLRSSEILGITVIGLCLASALIAGRLGFSPSLGAFLMGSIIGVTKEIDQVQEWVHPVRDMFTAIFFVAAGMLIQPALLVDNAFLILAVTLLTLAGKILFGTAGSFAVGQTFPDAIRTGFSLTRLGEISFVFGALALRSKETSDFLYPLALTVCSLTTLATPLMAHATEPAARWIPASLPALLMKPLDAYHAWTHRTRPSATEGTVLSRYLLRLGLYSVVLIASFAFCQNISHRLLSGNIDVEAFALTLMLFWATAFIVLVPVILAVAYYLNHFFLLILTELVVRMRAAHLLSLIPIQRTYRIFEFLIMGILSLAFFSGASEFLHPTHWLGLALSLAAGTFMFRRTYRRFYLIMEDLLDHLLGLATSEPLRPAAMTKEGAEGVLTDAMEKIMVDERSPAVHQTIRALGLREKAGVNVVAMYRRGKLKTNPKPDTTILANDILVILGDEKERAQARSLLEF